MSYFMVIGTSCEVESFSCDRYDLNCFKAVNSPTLRQEEAMFTEVNLLVLCCERFR